MEGRNKTLEKYKNGAFLMSKNIPHNILPITKYLIYTTQLQFEETSSLYSEKVMAPHSSTLAWKIPWTEEPGRLQSVGSLRVGHD